MIDMKDKARHAEHMVMRRWNNGGYWEYDTPPPAKQPTNRPNHGHSGPEEFVLRNKNNLGEHSGYNGFSSSSSSSNDSSFARRGAPSLNGSASGLSSGSLPKQTQTIRMGDEKKTSPILGHVDPPATHTPGWVVPGERYGTGGRDRNYVPPKNNSGSSANTEPPKTSASMSRAEVNMQMSRFGSEKHKIGGRVPKFTEIVTAIGSGCFSEVGSCNMATGNFAIMDFAFPSGSPAVPLVRTGYVQSLKTYGLVKDAAAFNGTGIPLGWDNASLSNPSGIWKYNFSFSVKHSAAFSAGQSYAYLKLPDNASLNSATILAMRNMAFVAAGSWQNVTFDIILPVTGFNSWPLLVFYNGTGVTQTYSLGPYNITAMKVGDF